MKLFSIRAITVLFFLLCFLRLASAQFMPASLPPVISLLLDESRLEMVLDAYDDPSSEHIFVAAHRGGKEFDAQEMIPGNSIANIANAVSKGFDIYESDIEILGDGTLVVFHDDNFDCLTNTEEEDDSLGARDLTYAKDLYLTYDGDDCVANGNEVASGERIPTLEEFLIAAKGKIMLKFDLKSFSPANYKDTLLSIFNTVVETDTVDQVLIRGGSYLLDVANDYGFDTRMIMLRYQNDAPTAEEVTDLADDYDVRAISIDNGAGSTVIEAAIEAGLVVEIHELNGFTDQQRADAINAGVRQFHSFAPTPLLNYLEQNGHREF